jgi:N-acetyl-anhydromuramyl-L-alanine amidase AmpD
VETETAAPAAEVAKPTSNTSNDLKYDTQGDLQKIIEKNEALDTPAGKKKADKEIAAETEKPEFKPKGLAITTVYKDFPSQTYGKTASANKKPFAGVVLHHDPAKNMSYYGQVDKVRKGQFGYHFTIAEDGTIYQAAPMNARTNHIGNKGFEGLREDSPLDNSNAIGIAYLGGENPSPQATEAIKKLMAKLKGQYGDLVTASHPSVSKAGHKSKGEGAVWKDALAKEGFRVM